MRSSLAEYTAKPVPTAMTARTTTPVLVLKNDPELVACFGVVFAGAGATRLFRGVSDFLGVTAFAMARAENEGGAGGGACWAACAKAGIVTSIATIIKKVASGRNCTKRLGWSIGSILSV
jgi:hypothetical protein